MEEPYRRLMGNKSIHASKLQQHLFDQMLSQSEFCDVTLIVGSYEMKAHWCVLVSCPYFQSLYDSGLEERVSGKVNVSVGKPAALRSAINFLYDGLVEISYDGIRDLLEVADYLQICDLKKTCTEYLSSVEVTVDNSVNLCLLASLYDLDIYNRMYDYVRGHLPDIMKKDDILTLTHDSILGLLMDKTLTYVNQEDFFDFILRWVSHDVENREEYFKDMFCALDLQRISKDFLERNVESCPLLNSSEECKLHVLNIKMKQMAGLIPEENGHRDVILLAGGSGHGLYIHTFLQLFPLADMISLNNIYGYVIQENRWAELAPLPYQMKKPIITNDIQNNYMYVYDSNPGLDSCSFYLYKFHLLEKKWSSIRVLVPEACSNLSINHVLSCNGKVYIVMSAYYTKSQSHIEWQCVLLEVDEEGNESLVRCMIFQRSMKTQVHACMALNRYICIIGWKTGIIANGRSRNHSRFVYYDTVSMRRFEFSKGAGFEPLMFTMDNDLILTKPGCYRSKRFSFHHRRWFSHKELVVPLFPEEPSRIDYMYTIYNGQLFVFGGKSPTTKKPIDSALKYNFEEKQWSKLETMPQALMNSGTCIVRIPNDHVRCHINCPHCTFHSRRSQATYQIDYPEDDEDDEDYSYDGDDLPSDYWDDDDALYDNFEDMYDPYNEFWY
ncbi:hypothetical protein ACJMK2_036495 [Sinanodonta woodiana]|uniref:BTB domain-containing protein n=1 Tax=Sinanodonta woodiana TaxID=1069815 RepID=A0ABD3WHD1_SINWO